MLDGWARRRIDPALDAIAGALHAAGISANAVTLSAFAIGAGAATAIALGHLWAGLVLIFLSRLCDGLDGAVAKRAGRTDLGGYLDIVLDFSFYGMIPLAFVILDPANNGVPGAVLLAAFYANGASFLAFAAMAERRGMSSDARGPKSLFFTTGLAEATETLGIFVAFCVFPVAFPVLAYCFAAMTAHTTLSRLILAYRLFGETNGS
ncbi:CDP-alcohol phosphatidyltransferase family protein [Mesorhizobium sp. J428]|uniref:CDP-alcohol phosphatidyltransferase family protein n=1 Tax=Mesorhizobium sp. J428 TaxID=2898440 RepID=UPI002150ACBF|nr:CDP-alcohol phosphatidyltransferase family protein [Mesorhizobium sp. J428]MCR5858348.1 CDP-alcohol phosphatidyltransferase family protein [Mesorhizobium sp. J428]